MRRSSQTNLHRREEAENRLHVERLAGWAKLPQEHILYVGICHLDLPLFHIPFLNHETQPNSKNQWFTG